MSKQIASALGQVESCLPRTIRCSGGEPWLLIAVVYRKEYRKDETPRHRNIIKWTFIQLRFIIILRRESDDSRAEMMKYRLMYHPFLFPRSNIVLQSVCCSSRSLTRQTLNLGKVSSSAPFANTFSTTNPFP